MFNFYLDLISWNIKEKHKIYVSILFLCNLDSFRDKKMWNCHKSNKNCKLALTPVILDAQGITISELKVVCKRN